MHTYTFNKRLPYMSFNWAEHGSRTARLTREERGLYDEIRTELWSVEGVTMDLGTLRSRLRLTEGDQPLLDTLAQLGLLKIEDGMVFDDVQRHEYAKALEKAEQNRLNGKRGGRPPKQVGDF